MSILVVGECARVNMFERWDSTAVSESQLEYVTAKTFSCIYPQYQCIVFGGSFRLDNQVSRPDLALIAKDFSHWFIVEVELASHSLGGHVLPQVRTFQYGEPMPDCVSILARETGYPLAQMQTFLRAVPRSVAVVADKRLPEWDIALRSLQVQLLTVSVYRSSLGTEAVEMDGQLEVLQEHLGYGLYAATDRSIRFPSSVRLPDGDIMIVDRSGVSALWRVRRVGKFAWITKDRGSPEAEDGALVQLVRVYGGNISLR